MGATRTSTSLGRWDNEGGAQGARPNARHAASPRTSALYYFNVRSDGALMDDPEGSTLPNTEAAIDQALALARDSLADGARNGEDRRSWHVEIMDRGNQHLVTVRFADACTCVWPRENEGTEGGSADTR